MPTGAARVRVRFKKGNKVVSGTPTFRAGILCVTLRGPFDRRTISSERMFEKLYGGPFDNEHCKVPQNIKQFFDCGGTAIDVRRIVHFTDPGNVNSATSAKGEQTITNEGASESPATVTTTAQAPFSLEDGDDLEMIIGGGAPQNYAIEGTRASQVSVAGFPVADQVGNTLTVKVNKGSEQIITFASPATTAAEFQAQINEQLEGGRAVIATGEVRIETDRQGTEAYFQVTGGSANGVLNYPTTEAQGTGDFENLDAITATEFKTWVEDNFTGVTYTDNPTHTGTFSTTATGAAATIQMAASAIVTALGLDTLEHTGADATPEDTLKFQGKTDGDYTDDVSFQILDATNGEAARFDIITYFKGVVQQRYRNYTMDSDDALYVATNFNDDTKGDDLLDVVDLDLVGGGMSVLNARPKNGTYSALTGGDNGLTDLEDADFVGTSAGKTGLYTFDTEEDVKLIGIPGRSSTTIHASMHSYETSRDHMVYMVHPTPEAADVATAQAMKTFSETNLFGQSEFGCCGWPRIQIPNLWTDIFGDDEGIYVCPSMSKMGKFQYNDENHPDGVFVSSAGVDNGNIPNVIGIEIDEVKDVTLRGLVADVGIEPIWKETTRHPYCFDGGDNLKMDGDWPRQWHARGVIYIVESLRRDAISMKHKKNNDKNRGEWERRGSKWLGGLPEDAFDPDKETFWQVNNEELNPPEVRAQQEMVGLLGLGFSDDAKYVTIEVTRTLAG